MLIGLEEILTEIFKFAHLADLFWWRYLKNLPASSNYAALSYVCVLTYMLANVTIDKSYITYINYGYVISSTYIQLQMESVTL